jgi:hypothetical protein
MGRTLNRLSAVALRDCRSVEQVSPSDRSVGVPSGPEHDIFGRLAARSVEIASHDAPGRSAVVSPEPDDARRVF